MRRAVQISLFLWCSVSFLVSEGTAPVFPQSPEAIEAGRKAALARHNVFRCMHGAPPFALDETVNKVAQDYADKLAAEDKFEHSKNPDYGESIYSWSRTGFKAGHPEINVTPHMISAANAWYSEEEFYKPLPGQTKAFSDPDPTHETGHFTQLVWKDTQRLGIGVSISQVPHATKKNEVWTKVKVVANYVPLGNGFGSWGNLNEAEYYAKNVEPCPSKTEAECGGVVVDFNRVEKEKFCDKLYGKRVGGGGPSNGKGGSARGNGTEAGGGGASKGSRGGTEEAGGAEGVALSTFPGLLSLLMSLKIVF